MDEREAYDVREVYLDRDLAEYQAMVERGIAGDRSADEPEGSEAWPVLSGLTEQAVRQAGELSDDALVEAMQATDRQIAREHYKKVMLVAEFGRRRQAEYDEAVARGVPAGAAPGAFPGEELAIELRIPRAEAGHLIDDAVSLTSRLPRTLDGMAAGTIDYDRASWVAFYTRELSDADAARADEVLAGAAPELRADQVARRGAALEKKLNPEAARARRERTRREHQRVEARREVSGNASLSAREMNTADTIASKEHIDALALKLRAGGVPGSLDALRVLVFTDLTQGRDPLDRLEPRTAEALSTAPEPADPDAWPGWGASHDDEPEDAGSGEPASRPPAPMPALVNLLVPVGTLLGWSNTPAQAGAWGLLDGEETRSVVGAAAQHALTRWCVTLTAPDGTALAHGCSRGQHPHLLAEAAEGGPAPPGQVAALLRGLNLTFTAVARGRCDHAGTEDHYTPSRALRHLVRARRATCDAPGCDTPAVSADLDHTVPWPDGPTDQCNLAPRCRTHHRAKQAPDWTVEQLEPGVTRWTLPSGRTHVTGPTKYDC